MKKRKLLIITSLFIGTAFITTSAFSAFILKGDQDGSLDIDISGIEVKDYSQKIISYLNNDRKLSLRGDDIVNDVYSLAMSFDTSEYTSRTIDQGLKNLYFNSALKISVTFENSTLFNHLISEDNFKKFINFSYEYTTINSDQQLENKIYYLSLEDNMSYSYYFGESASSDNYEGSRDCLTYTSNTIELIIPTAPERCASLDSSNNKNFYLTKIYNDNQNVQSTWNFYINLNFNIVDEICGYSTLFNASNLGSIKVKLNLEDLRAL